ncbi:MAG: glycoside hydrolase family 13 protein [Eubacteriales bacterium]|nr:glycoside hydrolase family 13 protein [Eubacteriales bacterium]
METFRNPVGPVKAGGKLTLRFYAKDCAGVDVRTWNGEEHFAPMKPIGDDTFELTLTAPEKPMVFWYDFVVHAPEGDARYGTSYDQLGGEGAVYAVGAVQSYQVTVYDPAYQTPKALHSAVIYQIFPDRFRKKGRLTEARRQAIEKAHPDATFHAKWEEAPLLLPDPINGDNRAHDFFGGTLAGIAEKLDELAELGVTVLYLNPVFRSASNHRYNTGDYMEIDPILGTNADFTKLCKAAAERGITVLMDGVFSHTGSDSLYFNRDGNYDSVGAYQSPDSPYADWYTFRQFPDDYECWWGVYTLPAVRKENPEYQAFLTDEQTGVLPEWIRRGAGGWRLDVADELPMELIGKMRRGIKALDPDAALIGEVWEDASNKIAYGSMRSYCLGDTLDSVMNYPLRRGVIDFFTGAMDAPDLCRLLLHQREVYPAPFYYSLMNLLGSHDRVRILNALSGYDREGAVQMPREESRLIRLTPEQLAQAKARYVEAMRLLCAIPGAPTIYYGDEIGMTGMADPWNRTPMDWKHADEELRGQIAALLRERRKSRVLQTGFFDCEALDADTLLIRRYAVKSKDAFGATLRAADREVRISRNI